MRVNVGLETSSVPAAPSPSAMPLARVVFPAPRLPISKTAARRGNWAARTRPRAMVSSSDAVRYTGTQLHGFGKIKQQIGGNQALLPQFSGTELAAESVQIDSRGNGLLGIIGKLGEEPGDKTGEDVARAAGGHRG